jgi:hypothetical protein
MHLSYVQAERAALWLRRRAGVEQVWVLGRRKSHTCGLLVATTDGRRCLYRTLEAVQADYPQSSVVSGPSSVPLEVRG